MLFPALCAVASCAMFSALPAVGQVLTHADPDPNEAQQGFLDSAVVIQLAPGLTLDETSRQIRAGDAVPSARTDLFGDILDEFAIELVAPVLREMPSDPALASRLGLDRMYLITLSGVDRDSEDLSERLSCMPESVLFAQPVRIGRTMDIGDVPNDTLFDQQHALRNAGQSVGGIPGLPGADINAVRAWRVSAGSWEVPIAVLDSGVSYAHTDLFFKIFDAHNTTGSGSVHDGNDSFNSHGTHVAGIAAASSNNRLGITGMSWGSPILAVKVANLLGFTSDVWLGQGLIWAADNSARVAVVSIGMDTGSDFLHAAVKYATERGVVICASTGNTGQPGVKYPARYPETIAVGATDNRDMIAEFSTTGPEVTVVAPGVGILSTWDDFLGPPTYAVQSGTSSSCPLVAGVVALMISVNPGLNTEGVVELMKLSVIDAGPTGFDQRYGWGRLDAYRAVTAAQGVRACAADINQNGQVESSDFSAWVGAFESHSPLADQNFDGVVTATDFSSFLANYILGCE